MPAELKTDNTGFLPNFCRVEVLFAVILSAELLAMLLTLAPPLYPREVLFDLAMYSLFIQWIALTSAGLLCFFKRFMARVSELHAAFFSYFLILTVTFIITEIAWHLFIAPQPLFMLLRSIMPEIAWHSFISPQRITINGDTHILFLSRSLSIAAIVGAVLLRYLYVQHQWRKNVETIASARYQALQSRIRPHFLFNCMNTIASLTRKSPRLAEASIEDLTDLFRASLEEPGKLVKITDEWAVCETYLRIEKHRLADRLTIAWDIDTLPTDVLVPPLCIQPILENAVYHGIERLPEGGTITIRGEVADHVLFIRVINPVPAKQVDDVHKGNKHAQENIRQRLRTVFGNQGDLSIDTDADLYTVSLKLPCKGSAE